jgi:hypothetical protein
LTAPQIKGDLGVYPREALGLEWIIPVKALLGGEAETFLRWDEIEGLPRETLSKSILVLEMDGQFPDNCLKDFITNKFPFKGVLIRAPRLALARQLIVPLNGSFRILIFGVISDYYTCHLPLSVPGTRDIFRYCLRLRQGSGIKARIKQRIKVLLAGIGMGRVLCDYFILIIERTGCDY